MDEAEIVSDFHGVYLLVSSNPKTPGAVYIGYTVNPSRRIRQHNKGRAYGGANKTSAKGPHWTMVLIVHGFPSAAAALQFEWAWQYPEKSRRLLGLRRVKRKTFDYCFEVMLTMLSTNPWCRLPLILRWLSPSAAIEPPAGLAPPAHIPIVYGDIKVKAHKKKKKIKQPERQWCIICKEKSNGRFLKCLSKICNSPFHLLCLARLFLQLENAIDSLIPIEGECPECHCSLLWGDLIRKCAKSVVEC